MALSGTIATNHFSDSNVNETWMDFNWSATQNQAGNYSDVSWEIRARRNSSNWIAFHGTGGAVNGGPTPSFDGNHYSNDVLCSGSFRVYHDAQGNGSFSMSMWAYIYYSSAGKIEASGTCYLNKIPRYLNSCKLYLKNTYLNVLQVNWTCSPARNYTQYRIKTGSGNYGNWTDAGDAVASDGKSGWFNIGGLKPNTSYTIQVRLRRQDSGLWSESNTITATTKNIATITSPNSNFSHNSNGSLTVKCNNPSGQQIAYFLDCPSGTRRLTSGRTTNTSYTWSAAQILSMLQYFTTKNSSSIKVGVITYAMTEFTSDSEYYNERTGTLNVVNSNPTFNNFTYEDIDSKCIQLTGGNQGIIKGYSDVKIKVSAGNKAVGKNYATISKYRAVIGEQQKDFNYSSSNEVNTIISNVLSNIFIVYAIDSRGNSTQKQISPSNYYNYSKIQIKEGTAVRTGGVGSEVTLSFNGTYWNKTFGNITNSIKSLKYYYKQTSSSTWITGGNLTPTKDGENFTYSATIRGDLGADGFNITKSFNIKIVATDELSSSEYTITLGSGTPAIALYKNGVGINQMFDTSNSNALQVGGGAKANYFQSTTVPNLPSGTDSREYWAKLTNGIYWYGNSGAVSGMPSSWGFVIKMGFTSGGDFNVLFFTQSSGKIYRKSGNVSTVSSWTDIANL